MGLGYLGLLDATIQAFAAALQGVVNAWVVSALTYSSSFALLGKVASLSLIHLLFMGGVAGDIKLTPIW